MREAFKIMIIGAIVLIAASSGWTSSTGTPSIELSATHFDMGDIYPEKGIVTETFFVKNTGGAPLNILGVSTSCGCTDAEVESETVMPNEQTKLVVSYDPSTHPGLVGRIKRVVYIKSNDPLNEEIELEITGNSMPAQEDAV